MTFYEHKRNTGKCFERPAKILRGMHSSVPKRKTGKCLLTVGIFNTWVEEHPRQQQKLVHLVKRANLCLKHRMCRKIDSIWVARRLKSINNRTRTATSPLPDRDRDRDESRNGV